MGEPDSVSNDLWTFLILAALVGLPVSAVIWGTIGVGLFVLAPFLIVGMVIAMPLLVAAFVYVFLASLRVWARSVPIRVKHQLYGVRNQLWRKRLGVTFRMRETPSDPPGSMEMVAICYRHRRRRENSFRNSLVRAESDSRENLEKALLAYEWVVGWGNSSHWTMVDDFLTSRCPDCRNRRR